MTSHITFWNPLRRRPSLRGRLASVAPRWSRRVSTK